MRGNPPTAIAAAETFRESEESRKAGGEDSDSKIAFAGRMCDTRSDRPPGRQTVARKATQAAAATRSAPTALARTAAECMVPSVYACALVTTLRLRVSRDRAEHIKIVTVMCCTIRFRVSVRLCFVPNVRTRLFLWNHAFLDFSSSCRLPVSIAYFTRYAEKQTLTNDRKADENLNLIGIATRVGRI